MSGIKITTLNTQSNKKLQASSLSLEFSGKPITEVRLNTLRRVLLLNIPTYAFTKDTINITNNTSIYNNDYMRLRLSQITFPNIKHNIIMLDEKYYKGIDYKDSEREKHSNDVDTYELYVNAQNDTNKIISITTATPGVQFFKNGKEIVNTFDKNYPHLILKLKKGQSFNCQCTAVLNIGETDNIWSSVANCWYKETGKNKFNFTLQSQGQRGEKDLLITSCKYIKNKLNKTKIELKNQFKGSDAQYVKEIIFDNITEGFIINDFLQEHTNVLCSGAIKKDLLVDRITVKFKTNKKSPQTCIFEAIDKIIKFYDVIENGVKKN